MNLKQLTTRSTFQKRTQTSITSLIKPLLFLGAVLFSNFTFADIRIAVVDTGFCSAKVKVKSKTHKVFPARDMTGTNKMNCAKITAKELEQSARYHGQKVLNEFLSFLPKKAAVKVYPLVVYDKKGAQTQKGWRNTLEYIEKEKIDMVLTASGFITSEKLVEELPAIWFVPSGRIERMIDSKTVLFPQSLAPKPNLFLIGDYFEGTLYDQNLLYQDQIDYYFPSGKKAFKGTSRAVAEAMGRALDKCFIPKDIIAAHSLRLCLLKHEKVLKDRILKKEFKTF